MARIGRPRIPAWAGTALRCALFAGLAAFVLRSAGAGATLATLRAAEPGAVLAVILAGILIVQGQILLSALRWRFTAARLGMALSAGRAVREYYVATFLNQILPGGVAGDALRTWRNRPPAAAPLPASSPAPGGLPAAEGIGVEGMGGESGRDWTRMLRAVVLERAAGQAVLFLLVAAGLACWSRLLPVAAPAGAGLLAAAGLLVALSATAGLIAAAVIGARSARNGGCTAPRGRGWRALAGLGPDLRRVFVAGRAWAIQPALSIAIVGGYVAVFVLAGRALGADLPPATWITVIPLILLAMLVPASIGGWGWREGAAVVLLPLVGIAPPVALAIAILYGLINLAGSLPGLAILAACRRSAADAPPSGIGGR